MSNQANPPGETDPKIVELLRQGIIAARAGEKTEARDKLRQVTALDQFNEQAWFWLASVVETIEERRICLGNVISINPDNERAKELLGKMTFGSTKKADDYPVISTEEHKGISRVMLGLVLGVIVVIAAIAIILPRISSQPDALPTSAQIAQAGPSQVADTPSGPPMIQTASSIETQISASLQVGTATILAATNAVAQTEAAIAIETRRAQVNPTLAPSWTPRPVATARGTVTATPLASPPPQLVQGQLIVQRGRSPTNDGTLPFSIYNLSSGSIRAITGTDRGAYGIFSPDGRQFIYSRFVSGTRDQLLIRIITLNSAARPEELSSRWGSKPPLADQWMPTVSRNGKLMIFSARSLISENERTNALYALAVNLPPARPSPVPVPTSAGTNSPTSTPIQDTPAEVSTSPTPTPTPSAGEQIETAIPVQVRRLTVKDDGFNVWPNLSPDGRQIVYVRQERTGNTVLSADLMFISPEDGASGALTNDGPVVIESAPRWSPDGRQIVYEALSEGSKERVLYIIHADSSDPRPLEKQSSGDNQGPVWSPDGKWIAFASNRTGKFELFVVEVQTGQTYQLTSSPDPIFVTDWAW